MQKQANFINKTTYYDIELGDILDDNSFLLHTYKSCSIEQLDNAVTSYKAQGYIINFN